MPSRRFARADAPPAGGARGVRARPAADLAAVGVVLAIAGLASGATPLLVAGAGAVALAALAVLTVLGVSAGIGVDTRPPAGTIIEGRSLKVAVDVTGPRLFGYGGAELHHPLLARSVGLGASAKALRPRRRHRFDRPPARVTLGLRAGRRGRLVVQPPWLSISDPLGLVRLNRGAGTPAELLVLPRLEPVRWVGQGARWLLSRQSVPGGTADIDGLREYAPGTPANRIHWPALASGSELLERVTVSEVNLIPLIAIDPRTGPGLAGERELDTVIRSVASLTLELARRVGGVDLLLPGRAQPVRVDGSLGTWAGAHTALAVLASRSARGAAPPLPAQPRSLIIYARTAAVRTPRAAAAHAARLITLAPGGGEEGGDAIVVVGGCVASRPLRRSRGPAAVEARA